MGDVAVLEAAHHVHDGVDLADGGEELVAEPLALGGAAHQAGDIDEDDARRNDLGRLAERRQPVQPRIRHRDLADIGLDGAERIIGGLRRRRLGQRVEERRLADIRQADDAAFKSHGIFRVGWLVYVIRFRLRRRRRNLWRPWRGAPCSGNSNPCPRPAAPALSATMSHSASTQGHSSLAKSCST